MQKDQSSINRWTWIIAIALAALLLWMLFTNRGPSNTCCSHPSEIAQSAEQMNTQQSAEAVALAFSFSATDDEVLTSGDTSNVPWLQNAERLRSILDAGEDLKVEGNDKTVKLTGFAITDAERQKRGEELQAFFGSSVTVDNQLTVIDSAAAESPTQPAAVKLYFDTGKTALPADADNTLSATIQWLKTNPSSKAVLSGYHDASGDKAFNEELAKNRAKVVREAIKASGIDEARIEMRKPEVVEGDGNFAEARRVEVSIE